MTQVTKKSFDILHEKMMLLDSYRLGYEYGTQNRKHLKRAGGLNIKAIRRIYLKQHTNFAAGIARVCLELLVESNGHGEAA